MRRSARAKYIELVTGTGLNLLKGDPLPSVRESVIEIGVQANRDFHLDNRDAGVIAECVESWIHFIDFMEAHDGGGHGQVSANPAT